MAARHGWPASDSEDEDCDAAADDYITYASPRQTRLGKHNSRKGKRAKVDSRRSSIPVKKARLSTGRTSPANASSGSEDKRSAEKRAALAEVESRSAQRRWDRFEKLSMSTQQNVEFDEGHALADGSVGKGMYSSFSELSHSSDGSVTPSLKTPLARRAAAASAMARDVEASTPVISTAVGRENLHQHVCRVVRGLELVQSARFYVNQALSIGADYNAEADQKAASNRLWLELQSALKDRDKDQHESVLRLARGHVAKLMCEIEQFHLNAERVGNGFALTAATIRRTFAKAIATTYCDDSQKKIEAVDGIACFSKKHKLALRTVNSLLAMFDQACTFYPSLAALLQRERPDGEHEEFDNRHSTLLAWSNASWQLATLLSILKAWMQVDVSRVCLEYVEVDDASEIVLAALSNQVVRSGDTLVTVDERLLEDEDKEEDDHARRMVAMSLSEPSPSSNLAPGYEHSEHDVLRSQSDSSGLQRGGNAARRGDSCTQRYSRFVSAALKRFSLTALLRRLLVMVDDVLQRVHSMFLCPDEQAEFSVSVPQFAVASAVASSQLQSLSFASRAVSFASLSPSSATAATLYSRQHSAMSSVSTSHLPFPSPSSWEEEFAAIGLPSLAEPYLALLRVPVDVTQEVIRSWLENQPSWKPSAISIRQLISESKELLVAAYEVKLYYAQLLEAILPNLSVVHQRQLEVSQVTFEQDLRKVLEAYLDHLHSYVQKIARADHAAVDPVNVLEQEWQFIARLVPQVRRGMSNVGRRFCIIAQGFMQNTANFLDSGLDDCTTELHNLDRSLDLKAELLQTSRSFRKLFEEVRERSSKAVGFGRMLRKEMQIAADFSRLPGCNEAMLIKRLQDTGHVMVLCGNGAGRPLFVSPSLITSAGRVLRLLDVACGHGGSDRWHTEDYLILLPQSTSPSTSASASRTGSMTSTSTLVVETAPMTIGAGSCPAIASSYVTSDSVPVPVPGEHDWDGAVIEVEPTREMARAIMDLQIEDVKLVVPVSSSLPACRAILLHLCSDLLEISLEHTSTYHDVGESLADLTVSTIELGSAIIKAVHGVGRYLMQDGINELEDGVGDERLIRGYIKTMQRCYGTAFEFLSEVDRLVSAEQRLSFGIELCNFVTGWMQYVSNFCDMSPNSQPRWMAQGLSIVALASREDVTRGLSEDDYQHFSFEVTEFLDKFQYSSDKVEDEYDSSPHAEESPWHQEPPSPTPKRCLTAPILVRHRARMIARRTNSERVLRWYSSASGSSSPVVQRCDPFERGASLPLGIPRSASSSAAAAADDSSSADESHSMAFRRVRSTSEPAGRVLHDSVSLSPVIGSPNDMPMEALKQRRDFLHNQAATAAELGSDYGAPDSMSPFSSLLAASTPKDARDDGDGDAGDGSADGADSREIPATPSPDTSTGSCGSGSRSGGSRQYASLLFSTRIQRCQLSLQKLEEERSSSLLSGRLVGKVLDSSFRASGRTSIISLKLKQVRFRWQRGNKIGVGKFGQVYSCVNLDTGTIMAVKEVTFQGSSSGAIKDLADEIKMMENVNHPHLVHYYGVETHKEELLIFMEYCSGGTMHDLAKQGPPESEVRVWIHQLLLAVQVLHENCIVHGDIKGANIFLTPDGIKLGDFGSSVKLADVAGTAHGELIGLRGTVAYMAPEVITQNQGRGFGRPADIWSVGCVLVELATGKHPWSECDNEFSIMYRVGDGKTPTIPDSLSVESVDFLEKCFVVDPENRCNAGQLLDHLFVRTSSESL